MSDITRVDDLMKGCEEEFLLVYPDGEVAPKIEQVLLAVEAAGGPLVVKEVGGPKQDSQKAQVTTELHGAQVELVHQPVKGGYNAFYDLICRNQASLNQVVQDLGCSLLRSATHPWANPHVVPITNRPRYQSAIIEAGIVAKENMVCSLHIHKPRRDRQLGFWMIQRRSRFSPLFRALSANSPFFKGEDTGFCSYRTILWKREPRTGYLHFPTLQVYEKGVEALIRRGIIKDEKSLYPNERLHPFVPTNESREPCKVPV